MNVIKIEKNTADTFFEYALFRNEKKLASIKGSIQNKHVLWLWRYESLIPDEDDFFVDELQKELRDHCLKKRLQNCTRNE